MLFMVVRSSMKQENMSIELELQQTKGRKLQCPSCCNQLKGSNLLQQKLQTDSKGFQAMQTKIKDIAPPTRLPSISLANGKNKINERKEWKQKETSHE